MTWLDTKYASLISPFVRNFKVKGNSLWNFSCPLCGDSEKNTHKARGYIYPDKDELKYKCHNCGANSKFSYFLKQLNYGLYKQYNFEKVKSNDRLTPKKKIQFEDVKERINERKASIESLFEPLSERALTYLKNRGVTNIKDLYSTSNLKKFEKFFPDKEIPNDERIVFPIRNRQGKVIGISARSIDPKNKLRYVLLKLEDEPLIFGLDKVSLDKDVFVLEGAIDALHLNNAVAVNGADLIKVSDFIPKQNQILVFDNQPRNPEIIKKMQQACSQGYRIVIWPKDVSEKDVNLMVRTYGLEKVIEWLGNTYKGIACKAKITNWKRI